MDTNLNGMAVLTRTDDAVYLRIPPAFQHGTNGCSCGNCDGKGMWDTLVVPIRPDPKSHNDYAYTVHMPDKAVPAFDAYMAGKKLRAQHLEAEKTR